MVQSSKYQQRDQKLFINCTGRSFLISNLIKICRKPKKDYTFFPQIIHFHRLESSVHKMVVYITHKTTCCYHTVKTFVFRKITNFVPLGFHGLQSSVSF